MEYEIIANLEDKPGQLLKVLQPIAKYNGNIREIYHLRGETVKVRIKFYCKDDVLEKILSEIRKFGVNIESEEKEKMDVVLIGHVIDTDIRETIDEVNEIGLVADLNVRMTDPEKKSSVIMRILVNSENKHELINKLEKIGKKKDLLIIFPES